MLQSAVTLKMPFQFPASSHCLKQIELEFMSGILVMRILEPCPASVSIEMGS